MSQIVMFYRKNRMAMLLLAVAVMLVLAFPAFAQSSTTIDVDEGSFIAGINTWLPMAIGIAVIGVGIRGAFALAEYVGDMFINAFKR